MPDSLKIVHFPVCESTNAKALQMAAQGAAHGTVVLADRQTLGRGRGDKKFSSPLGGLYLSAILLPPSDLKILSLITLAAGLACADAVEEIAAISPLLKWPNDLYVDSLKLAGILTETGPYLPDKGTFPYVVVGIGLNVNTKKDAFDADLATGVTSLAQLTQQYYQIESLVKEIYSSLNRRIGQLAREQKKILSLWQKKDYLYGKTISWSRPDQEEIQGTGLGLTRNGEYLIQDDQGNKHPVLAGQIRLL